MKETRIAVVIESLRGGGAQRVVSRLIPAWIERGYSVTLITLQSADVDTYGVPSGCRRIVLGGTGYSKNVASSLVANWRRFRRLRFAIRASGATCVVSFLTSMNILSILACSMLSTRVVVSERTDPVYQELGVIRRVARRVLYRWATVVTANSRQALEVMAEYVPRTKLFFTPNPVEFPPEAAVVHENKTVLAVGRLVALKNHDRVVRAFSKIVSLSSDWNLEIVGDGPSRCEILEHVERQRVTDNVHLVGHVDDTGDYFHGAAIFVMASSFEGTPNALLEAMSHGLVCIVPDNLHGALEYLEDGVSGLVYPSGDEEALASCLYKAISDPLLRKFLGMTARERMRSLDVDSVVREWDKVLGVA